MESLQADYASYLEFVKNPYVLEFLGLPENKSYEESDFEQAIIDSLHWDFTLLRNR